MLRYADTARTFAEIGDDAALEYTVRKLIEYTKVVATSTGEVLRDTKAFEAKQPKRAA